jgi:hypothetical protein
MFSLWVHVKERHASHCNCPLCCLFHLSAFLLQLATTELGIPACQPEKQTLI